MQMRLQVARLRRERRANNMADENAQDTGKQVVGKWLKAKGTAIGVAVGAALVATGDYLCGDCGLIPWIIGLGKTFWGFF
mgnify:CR=1 FL=1